jgi:hypothetical protein
VVDQLYANAAQWVETSTIKSGACMMLGLPNGHGVWHHRFVVLTPWYLHAAVPMLPGQGIFGAAPFSVCMRPLQPLVFLFYFVSLSLAKARLFLRRIFLYTTCAAVST